MALPEPVSHGSKTLGESALCFGCCAAIVLIAALAFQWVMHLIP